MRIGEWKQFDDFQITPSYAADDGVREWFWSGIHPDPSDRTRFPSGHGHGLKQELEFLEFTWINSPFQKRGWVQAVDPRHVHRAVQLLRSQNVQSQLIMVVQREARWVFDIVEPLPEPERSQLIAELHPPCYILRQMMLEAAINLVAHFCDVFATHADTLL